MLQYMSSLKRKIKTSLYKRGPYFSSKTSLSIAYKVTLNIIKRGFLI